MSALDEVPTTAIRARLPTAAVAAAAGLGAIATSYAVSGFTPTFVASPVERVLSRSMPGGVVLWTIENVGSIGQQLNVILALGLTTLLLGSLAAFGIAVGRRVGTAAAAVGTTVVSILLVSYALTGGALASISTGLGGGIVVGVAEAAGRGIGSGTTDTGGRRRVVSGLAVALGLGALGVGSSVLGDTETTDTSGSTEGNNPVDATKLNGSAPADTDEPAGEASLSVAEYKRLAEERSYDDTDIEPLLSRNFFNVDINGVDPDLERADWSLSVTGNVETELEMTFEDIREYRAENRMVSLRCVGDSLNGKKMDNAVWTGVPMEPILEDAAPESDSCCVMLRAEDGFYEEFPLEALRDGLLAFGMNGQTLPRAHGFPLRALIPGHWGEVNVKWLTEIEILEEEATGYWEKRGWHGTGPVNTVAKLWEKGIVHNSDGSVTLTGHAYAGTRGIDRVEVSTDGGDSWETATLTEPLPGDDVWRQWRHELDSGGTEVVVRAVDGTGTVQTEEENGVVPSGATGWVRKTV